MKHKIILSLLIAAALNSLPFPGKADNPDYPNNRYPLVRKPYIELPLGSIKPKGWLLEMLERQKKRGIQPDGYPVSGSNGST